MLQHNHESTPFSKRKNTIILVCDALKSPANIGAVFRLCDAFGVAEIIFNTQIELSSNRLKRTARHTETIVKHRIVEDLTTTLRELEQKEFMTVALEISENSIPLTQLRELKNRKIALVIGNERHGVSEDVLQKVQRIGHIEMYGSNSSMNVAQATAIALYELTKP